MAALGADIGLALTQDYSLAEMLHRCAAAVTTHLEVAFTRIWMLNPEQHILRTDPPGM
jgi:hypothetical protein